MCAPGQGVHRRGAEVIKEGFLEPCFSVWVRFEGTRIIACENQGKEGGTKGKKAGMDL